MCGQLLIYCIQDSFHWSGLHVVDETRIRYYYTDIYIDIGVVFDSIVSNLCTIYRIIVFRITLHPILIILCQKSSPVLIFFMSYFSFSFHVLSCPYVRHVILYIYPIYALEKLGWLQDLQNEVGNLTRYTKYMTIRHKINIIKLSQTSRAKVKLTSSGVFST